MAQGLEDADLELAVEAGSAQGDTAPVADGNFGGIQREKDMIFEVRCQKLVEVMPESDDGPAVEDLQKSLFVVAATGVEEAIAKVKAKDAGVAVMHVQAVDVTAVIP